MLIEKLIAMLLQNLDENTNTELQNTENDSQKKWSTRNQPVLAISQIENHSFKSMNIRKNPKNSSYVGII